MDENNYFTLGIFAHANAGKTTVTENILYKTNVIHKIGRVDSGNTVTDSMSVEKERGITVRSSVVSFNIGNKEIFLIDTPGHVDFSAEVERAINTLDGAILVVSAVEGVEAQTYTIYEALKKKNVPVIVFINKMDRVGANYLKTIEELKEKLNIKLLPIYNVDVNDEKILVNKQDVDSIMNSLVEYDDLLLDKYLADSISIKEIEERIYQLSREGKISVAVGGTALKEVGIDELLECIDKCFPIIDRNSKSDFSAYVYMVRQENNILRNYIKILSGELKVRDEIMIEDGEKEKIVSIQIPDGSNFIPVDSAHAGQIVSITGISAKSGELIGNQDLKAEYISFVKPMLNMQVLPENMDELHDLYKALKILELEDPYLNVCASANNEKKIFVNLIGEVQGQILKTVIKERFNIDVDLVHANIIHLEAPTQIGFGEASYTRDSKIEFKVCPLPRGSGFQYESRLSTDYLLRKYQRQTERLVRKYAKQGVFGWEVTDALVILVNGRFDSMGSDPKDFNIAVPLALMRALKECKEVILEPISEYYVVIPRNTMNEVTLELSARNAFYEIVSENLEMITLHGEIPTKKISNFSVILNKLTSGRGIFSNKIKKYTESIDQTVENDFFNFDPRNEVKFVVTEMGGDINNLDVAVSKKRKASRSKFKWKSEERKKQK